MKRLFCGVAFAVASMGAFAWPACLTAADNWGGAKMHVLTEAAWGVTAAGLLHEQSSRLAQFGVAMIPGIAKEWHDCNVSGLASRRDLVSDAVGAALGVYLGGFIIDYRKGNVKVAWATTF